MSSHSSNNNSSENQAVITNLSHDGRGVITNNGKKVLIDGVLPGETVTWVCTKRHRRFDEAKVQEVLSPSNDRVSAVCPNFLVCGGCSYQHISSAKQLEYKQDIVAELLQHVGGKVKPKKWLLPLQADTIEYRTKARLGVRYVTKKEKVLIGFREKSSSFITDMDTCKVLHPDLDNLLKPLQQLINNLSNNNKIPQVELAMGDAVKNRENINPDNIKTSNIAVILRHLSDFTQKDIKSIETFAKEYNLNLFLQAKGPDSIKKLHGQDELFYSFNYKNTDSNNNFDINYTFESQDFTQVNLKLNSLMLTQAIDLLNLNGDEQILDLFCGLGNFTLPIARVLEKNNGEIVGIEGCTKMVQRAYSNASQNNINNANFECMDLYSQDSIDISSDPNNSLNKHYDCIVLDPPRSGAKDLLPIIAKNKPKKILYISCDPATFSRDVGILCNDYNFKLQYVGIMDMFPHTKHVETMGLLTLK